MKPICILHIFWYISEFFESFSCLSVMTSFYLSMFRKMSFRGLDVSPDHVFHMENESTVSGILSFSFARSRKVENQSVTYISLCRNKMMTDRKYFQFSTYPLFSDPLRCFLIFPLTSATPLTPPS